MIDFKFKVCYDFTGVTEEELNKLSAQDIMLHQCIIGVRILLERPLETVYLYKVEYTNAKSLFAVNNIEFKNKRICII